MPRTLLHVGTHRRPVHAAPADIAFGIYTYAREPGDGGDWRFVGLAECAQPGWIAAHPAGTTLYAVHEVKDYAGSAGGGVSAFRVDRATGALQRLGSQPTPPNPCHCAVDASGRCLVVASHGGGSVHAFPIRPDGTLGPESDRHQHRGSGPHPRRQDRPHAHMVGIDPSNRWVLVPDLGTDEVVVYGLEPATARLQPRPDLTVRLDPGSGPRHLAFHPAGRLVLLVNELAATLSSLAFDPATGALRHLRTLDLLLPGFAGLRSGGAIAITPDGRRAYATTRSHGSSGEPPARGLDAISWFDIDPGSGELSFMGRLPSGGEIPRSIAFDPEGHLHVAHQRSGTIIEHALDAITGVPRPTGHAIATPVPVCLCFHYT